MTQFYPISQPSLTSLETEYVTRAIESGWISSIGEYVDAFEEGFARFVGVEHAIVVSNGTVALHLALAALGIGRGDEVIVPDLSFIATANAVLTCGATPVFADVDQENLCLSPLDLERCLTTHTRAIIPVHLYGHPADMAAINAFAERHGLVVIEDAAEAHGASIGGRKVGSFGHCAAFSFYGNKLLTSGEGGMLTTSDAHFAARCRKLRDHAMSTTRRYWHDEPGYNYRITNLQAAVGCAQLARADELIGGRKQIFEWYCECLNQLPDITVNRTSVWADPVRWLMCVEIDELNDGRRSDLMLRLKKRGVDTRPYFYPMSDMPYFGRAETPVAHAVSERGLSLPTYIGLDKEDVAAISGMLKDELMNLRLLSR
jgi:perosamine synthetase